jgi:hypothetical protein
MKRISPFFGILVAALFAVFSPSFSLAQDSVIVRAYYTGQGRLVPSYYVPGECETSLKGLAVPVLPEDPSKEVRVGVCVDPQGELQGVVHNNSRDESIFAECLKLSTFNSALVFEKPAWGYSNIELCAYFIAEDCGGNDQLPQTRFRLDYLTVAACFDYVPVPKKLDRESYETANAPVRIRFHVDESGKTTEITALDKRGKYYASKILVPIMNTFVFAPAVKDGKPVASTLTLVIRKAATKGNGAILADNNAKTPELPALMAAFNGGEELNSPCFFTCFKDGNVRSIRLDGSLKKSEAMQILDVVRKWKTPVDLSENLAVREVGMRLKFVPGSSRIEYDSTPHVVDIIAPTLPNLNNVFIKGLYVNKLMNAVMTWDVDKTGKMNDFRVSKTSMPLFQKRLESMMKKNYKPTVGLFEGRSESFSIRARVDFVVSEKYWQFLNR